MLCKIANNRQPVGTAGPIGSLPRFVFHAPKYSSKQRRSSALVADKALTAYSASAAPSWQLRSRGSSAMATPQAVTALIRASRPGFKSTADKVLFAVHAIISVNGFSLRKVGEGVDDAALQGAAALPPDEVDIAGWNNEADGDGGTYSLLYAPEPGAQTHEQAQQAQAAPLLLLKGLRLAADTTPPAQGAKDGAGAAAPAADGGVLLVSLADVASGRPPVSIELRLDRYAPALVPGAAGFEHLEELIRRVQDALAEALDGQSAAKSAATAAGCVGAGTATSAGGAAAGKGDGAGGTQQKRERDQEAEELARLRRLQEEEEERRRRDPLRDDRYPPGRPTRGPPGWGPAGVGDEDFMPGGLPRPPGLGGLGGPGGFGGVPLGPRGLGGGMHVGPENPIFADRLRHPRGGPGFPPGMGGGGAVPGMRWDPIAPEGLQGWSPDDFTQEGRFQRGEGLNDIGRPPPGRGPDWDNMFG